MSQVVGLNLCLAGWCLGCSQGLWQTLSGITSNLLCRSYHMLSYIHFLHIVDLLHVHVVDQRNGPPAALLMEPNDIRDLLPLSSAHISKTINRAASPTFI